LEVEQDLGERSNAMVGGIWELIERGKTRLAEREEAAQEARDAAAMDAMAQEEARRQALIGELTEVLPEVLRPYANWERLELWANVRSEVVELCVPECTGLRVRFERTEDGWSLDPAVWVQLPRSRGMSEATEHPGYDWEKADDLEMALGAAALAFVEDQAILQRVTEEQAKHAGWEAERHQAWEEQERQKRETREREEVALWRVIELVKHDSVAAALVRVMAAVQDERALVQERMVGLDELMESCEERHVKRLRQAEEELRQANEVQRELEERASVAEDQARDLERKLKRGK
jgi:hypothetical protein